MVVLGGLAMDECYCALTNVRGKGLSICLVEYTA
jgi:hypothetical protein